MKFIFELLDDGGKSEIEGTGGELKYCIARLADEVLKGLPIPKEDFMKAFAIGLVREVDATEEEHDRAMVALLEKTLSDVKRASRKSSKREKPNLTDLDKEVLKSIAKEYKWIACDMNGEIWVHESKPSKGECMWHSRVNMGMALNKNMPPNLFRWCTWEDEEPWYIPSLLG